MFSLCRSPASIVFLDDDPDFLETLALLLPSRWRYDFYLRPAPLQERLETEAAAWTARVERRQAAVAGAGLGESLPARILRDWAEDGERYALAGICVVDYSMPAMSGLEFLERLPDWPGARILLTGRADEHIAVRAFNAGLIEQFIPKQGDDSAGRVARAIEQLMDSAQTRMGNPCRATLKPEQLRLLQHASVAAELRRWVGESGRVEYVALGEPFGLLGRDAAGRAGWLQLEAPSELATVAELAASVGWSSQRVEQLGHGRGVTNLEFVLALGEPGSAEVRQPFVLGTEGELLAAFFEVPAPQGEAPAGAYADFLARQPSRTLIR
jgi:CheY-like chemotaxis protein